MAGTFGELLRSHRLTARFGLRQFAKLIDEKPSNLSAIENSRRLPWKQGEMLEKVANVLGLVEGTWPWNEFMGHARIHRPLDERTKELLSNPLVLGLLNTIHDIQPTTAEMESLVKKVNKFRKTTIENRT